MHRRKDCGKTAIATPAAPNAIGGPRPLAAPPPSGRPGSPWPTMECLAIWRRALALRRKTVGRSEEARAGLFRVFQSAVAARPRRTRQTRSQEHSSDFASSGGHGHRVGGAQRGSHSCRAATGWTIAAMSFSLLFQSFSASSIPAASARRAWIWPTGWSRTPIR